MNMRGMTEFNGKISRLENGLFRCEIEFKGDTKAIIFRNGDSEMDAMGEAMNAFASRCAAIDQVERTEEQAWLEIRDSMADSLLNEAQKKAFVISILRGQLANQTAPAQVAGEAAALVWTKERPTGEGWYWYRISGQEKQSIDYFEIRNGKLCWYSASACGWVPVTWDLEFAGPIPEPQPPATPDHNERKNDAP